MDFETDNHKEAPRPPSGMSAKSRCIACGTWFGDIAKAYGMECHCGGAIVDCADLTSAADRLVAAANARMSDWFADVLAFYRKFRPHLIGTTPAVPFHTVVAARWALIREELRELEEASVAGDLAGIADGVLDLVYALMGLLIVYGINPHPVWRAIQVANMRKVRHADNPDAKVQKPPGWTPPDVAGLLAIQEPIQGEPTT